MLHVNTVTVRSVIKSHQRPGRNSLKKQPELNVLICINTTPPTHAGQFQTTLWAANQKTANLHVSALKAQ